MHARPSSLHLPSPSLLSRGRQLAAWLLLGLFLLLWQASVARAADDIVEAQASAGMTTPVCAALDMDHDDPADYEVLPALHLAAPQRPLPQRFDVATVMTVRDVAPGLPPPRVAA